MSTKNRTRRTTTRNIRFPNQMIEQINIAFEQKGSGNFSAWVIEACRRRLTPKKRAYTSIKSDEEWTSRVLPSEQDDIVNSLNYEGIAVIELQFLPFRQWQTACWLCHSINSLNDKAVPWWSVNHQGITHIIIVLHQRCLNCSNASRDTLCSKHAITTSG